MNKVAICTHSVIPSFVAGESYEIITESNNGKRFKLAGGWIGKVLGDDPNEITVKGTDRVFATFNKGEARKSKSMMKMLVRAFVLVAKARGWGDSKNGAFKSWSGTPYNNTKDWARNIAFSYDCSQLAEQILEEDPNLKFIDQEAVNIFAENEIDNW